MATGDIYQASVYQTLHGVSVVNVLNYEQTLDSSGGVSSEQDLAEAIENAIIPGWAAEVSSQLTFNCVQVKEIGAGVNPPFEEGLGGVAGGNPGEAFPASTVACISFYSETYNKSGRGRVYISGMLISDEGDNCWTNTAGGKLFRIGELLRDPLTGQGSGLGNFKRVIYGGTPATAKDVVKMENRTQVRRHRSRTMKATCG